QRLPGCSTTRWSPLFTDIIPKGGSKWIGIEKVLEHFGIAPDETMAFGDGGNDVEMLRNAGIGVAMQNAEMGVQQAADYVTTSVDDDGIANALRHFRLI
ncbi:HAD hydrolase family protein, partial [Bacteroidales bacterium OttesenSCG-928-J16]|nr:HAD hydrolase family protein [Bacteroidales bacterium OttesenSCG-928-J16]